MFSRAEHCNLTPRRVCAGSARSGRVRGLHCSGPRVLWGNCLRRALGCVHFPGLSRPGSGPRGLPKGAGSVGPAFCAVPRPSSSGDQVRGTHSRPQVGSASYHLPGPSHSGFWANKGRAFSGVPCVSSGELTSGCDPPSGCHSSRIPRSLG